nr:type II secretion system protein [uncultured Psychroserpens sp.]
MNRTIKIRAFTLLESLITLMLISIIIALSYALINLIGKQLSLFEKENTQLLEYNLFNSTLINDINNSNDFTIEDNHLLLEFYDNSSIDYYIKKNMVLRATNNKQDAFNINTINYSFVPSTSKTYPKNYLELRLRLLKDTITTSYVLKKDNAKFINKHLFNED